MKNIFKNYANVLKNLREKNSLLFVLHVFFVGSALIILLIILMSGFYSLFGSN